MCLFAVALSGSPLPAAWEDGCFVAAAFVVGAIVGSFLNVVGYRVPIGRSVVAGRSACPACGRPVRARDNVPVLGWLILRGRCRDCGCAIPADYAVVEAGCGLALAALAAADIVAWRLTGTSAPLIDRLLVLGEWRWVLGWTGRAVAILGVVAWALLARGGHVVAWRTALVTAVGGAALVTAASPSPWWGAASAVGGAMAGWAAGRLLAGCADDRSLMLVGAVGGWTGVLVATVLVATARAGRQALHRWRGNRVCPDRETNLPLDLAVAATASLVAAVAVGKALERWFPPLAGW